MNSGNKITETRACTDEASLQLFSFYQHHLEQFDRLIRMVELLKQENQLLRNMIHKTVPGQESTQLPQANYAKPRVTCWPINKLEK